MPIIVLSYRRDDSKWIAGRIFDRLEDHYGKGHIFMDIDSIPVGLDFREHLQQSLARCDILLAVIGPRWLGTDEHGHHAVADETDWVRIEIETALAKKIPVIPILIDRLRMPKPSDLPETLRDFAFRQAAEIDSGVDFRSHVERLIRSIDQHLQGHRPALAATPPAKEGVGLNERKPIASQAPPAHATITAVAPSRSRPIPKAGLSVARSAAYSWIGIACLLLASEVLNVLGEIAVSDANRLLFTFLFALPLGAAGLILASLRLFKWTRLRNSKTGTRLSMLGAGVLFIAAIPTFFHVVDPPAQYSSVAAWPLVLVGGFGLALIAISVVANPAPPHRRTASLVTYLGIGIFLLGVAWLDSDLTRANLGVTDWQIRSVVIFTCVFVGGTLLLSTIASWFLAARVSR
jgi:TIR domain-containing protein